jgi:phage gp29-like protein
MELELNKPTFGTVAGRSAVLSLSYDYKENKNVGREKLPKTLQDYFVYMNDPHLASCIQSRYAGVQSKLYDIEYNGNMPEMFELVKDVIDSLDNNRIMREMLYSLLLGYSVSEIFWSIDNGFYVISDVIGKPSWWFDFDDNNLAYFKGEDDDKRILLDNNKFIVVQNNASYDNPHGEALLAKCYYALAFKKAGLELWVRFLDKYGIPVTTAKVANASNEVLKEVVSMLDDLKANGNAAFSDSVDVSMLDASGAKSDILFKDFIHY